jgi:hypothetical protein
MECECQLDDAEIRAQMTTGRRDRGDDRLAQFGGQGGELVWCEALQVGGFADRLEKHWIQANPRCACCGIVSAQETATDAIVVRRGATGRRPG